MGWSKGITLKVYCTIKVSSRKDKPETDFSEMRTVETTSKTQTVKVIFDIYNLFHKVLFETDFYYPKIQHY